MPKNRVPNTGSVTLKRMLEAMRQGAPAEQNQFTQIVRNIASSVVPPNHRIVPADLAKEYEQALESKNPNWLELVTMRLNTIFVQQRRNLEQNLELAIANEKSAIEQERRNKEEAAKEAEAGDESNQESN